MEATAWLHLALVGTPNSGKTALFNALTGSRQKVANYPGVTVERKAGALRHARRAASVAWSTCPAPIRCAAAAPTRRSPATSCSAGWPARPRPTSCCASPTPPICALALRLRARAEARRPAAAAGAQHDRHRHAGAASTIDLERLSARARRAGGHLGRGAHAAAPTICCAAIDEIAARASASERRDRPGSR